jgi:hypothetical protein
MEKTRKQSKTTPAPKKTGVFIVKKTAKTDDAEPTEAEIAKMRQRMKDEAMDEGTYKGALQYESSDFPVPPIKRAKGGMVTKGNGCAIRGVKKHKSY